MEGDSAQESSARQRVMYQGEGSASAAGEDADGRAPTPGVVLPIWSSGKANEPESQIAQQPSAAPEQSPEHRAHPGPGVEQADGRPTQLQRLTSRAGSQFSIRAQIAGNVDFSWHNVTVEIPEQPKKGLPAKTIIDNINGSVKSGSLLAIMGASGAGKTTFLNLLTDRTASALHVSAVLGINNKSVKPSEIRKISSYVQQQDLFFGNLTVIEHLTSQALLRMNRALSREERLERVHEVLDELGLTKVTNSFIGSTSGGLRGISGGEQKRLAFATEVLTDPPMMFADEPTSGLDSFASESVVHHLKSMAEAGRTILCTIHQPPSEVFGFFDQLLLLAEGRTAYLGPRADAVDYFSRIGYPCPSGFNPADFFIYTLAVKPNDQAGSKAQIKSITDGYLDVEKEQGIQDQPLPVHSERMTRAVHDMAHQHGENLWTQLRVVGWRTFLLTKRNQILTRVSFGTTLITSLIMGLVFLGTANENPVTSRVQGVAGSMFIVISLSAFTGASAIVQVVPAERPIFLREYENRMYSSGVYFFCRYLSTVPLNMAVQLMSVSIVYFLFGLDSTASKFFIFYVIIFLTVTSAESVGYILAAIAGDNVAVAIALTPVGTVPLMLFAGLLLNLDDTPVYFIWLEKISYMRWAFEAAMINEWRNDPISTTMPENSTAFNPFPFGDNVLRSYALSTDTDTIWINMLILLGLIIGYRMVALALTLIRLKIGVNR